MATLFGPILMVIAFGGAAIAGGVNAVSQGRQICATLASITNNTNALNASMQRALQSFEVMSELLSDEIIQTQMSIADNTQKLQQMQANFTASHFIMQVFLVIALIGIGVLLVLKHYNMLDWREVIYIILSVLTLGILVSLVYTLGFAPSCASTATPALPQFSIQSSQSCPCTFSASCPFGCKQGCWFGQLNFGTEGGSSLELQIVDQSANIIRDVSLPSFATTYRLDTLTGYSYSPLQANLRLIDQNGCPGPYISMWWINVDSYQSPQNKIVLLSPDQTTALTATLGSDGVGGISMTPYSQGSSSQQWTLWIDESITNNFFVLQNQGSKLVAEFNSPFTAQMVPLDDESNICVPSASCGPCVNRSSVQWTQAFGLYQITNIIGGVALYYPRNDGVYGIFNVQNGAFENSEIDLTQPLSDDLILPQWQLTYTI